MSNRVKFFAKFSFRGETLTPSMEINLDDVMVKVKTIPNFYPLLANKNNIDTYSYEYEMLLAEKIQCEAIEGWAADCIHQGVLNTQEFEQQWHTVKELALLNKLAEKHLDIKDLNAEPKLLAALKDAYSLGREA